MRPRNVSGFVESTRNARPSARQCTPRLFPPDSQQRANYAVLPPHADPGRRPAGGQAVDDRLHLIRRRVPGRSQRPRGHRIAEVAQLGFGATSSGRRLDDLGSQARRRNGVGLGLLAAKPVVHVERRCAIAQLAQCVPEAGRVGAAGDEADDLTARRDQIAGGRAPRSARAAPRRPHGDASRCRQPAGATRSRSGSGARPGALPAKAARRGSQPRAAATGPRALIGGRPVAGRPLG